MGLFDLVNVETYILNLVVNSSFAKKGLVVLLSYIITFIVRLHISTLLYMAFAQGTWVDLVSPVLISVFLYLISDNLYRYVGTHRPAFDKWVDYLITNYSEENFIRWKSYLSLGACLYVLLILCFVQIDNYYFFLTISQTIASAVICNLLERGMPQFLYNKLITWLNRPKTTKHAARKMIQKYRPTDPNQVAKRRSLDSIRSLPPIESKPHRRPTNTIERLQVENLPPKPPTPPLQVMPPLIRLRTPPIIRPTPVRPKSPTTIPPKPPTPPLLSD